jgi:hypothetical protein
VLSEYRQGKRAKFHDLKMEEHTTTSTTTGIVSTQQQYLSSYEDMIRVASYPKRIGVNMNIAVGGLRTTKASE